MKIRSLARHMIPLALAVYLLGVHDGKIALWEGDDPEPIRVFPYRASMLPQDARERLEEGIPIDSMEDLRKLAEAYLS